MQKKDPEESVWPPRVPQKMSPSLSRYEKRKLRRAGIPLAPNEPSSVNRRKFLQTAAAAGALAAIAPKTGEARAKRTEARTLFFNFSNHPGVGYGNFYAFLGGLIHPLKRAAESPALLHATRTNSFLNAMPSSAVTHVLESVELPNDSCALGYTIADANPGMGTWSMPHVFFTVPPSSLSRAYRQARTTLLEGQPLNLSAKREFYGAGPAMTLQDLIDESSLIDSNEHAAALTILHPDVLSIDSDSAAHVKTNCVDTGSSTKVLGKKLYVLGAATPVEAQGPNGPGWATMTPITDDSGQPLKYGSGAGQLNGLIQYDPVINPELGSFLANSTNDASNSVKNDPSLGADISAGIPNAGNLRGKLWSIHDSVTSVDQTVANLAAVEDASGPVLTLTKVNDGAGFILSGGSSQTGSGLVNIDLTATNSFVRWLALYITFYDEKGNVIPVADVPKGISANADFDLAATNRIYLGLVTPQFTLFGATVGPPSAFKMSFTRPAGASSADVLASGLGGSGSHFDQQTEVIGIVMTTLFCFVVPGFLLAFAAVPGAELLWGKLAAGPVLNNGLLPIAFTLWELANGDKSALYNILWKAIVKAGIPSVLKGLEPFIAILLLQLAGEIASLDLITAACPLAGIITRLIGMAAIAADIARGAHDVVVSPLDLPDHTDADARHHRQPCPRFQQR